MEAGELAQEYVDKLAELIPRLLANAPANGIKLSTLPRNYLLEYKEKLDCKAAGCQLLRLVQRLPRICKAVTTDEGVRLFPSDSLKKHKPADAAAAITKRLKVVDPTAVSISPSDRTDPPWALRPDADRQPIHERMPMRRDAPDSLRGGSSAPLDHRAALDHRAGDPPSILARVGPPVSSLSLASLDAPLGPGAATRGSLFSVSAPAMSDWRKSLLQAQAQTPAPKGEWQRPPPPPLSKSPQQPPPPNDWPRQPSPRPLPQSSLAAADRWLDTLPLRPPKAAAPEGLSQAQGDPAPTRQMEGEVERLRDEVWRLRVLLDEQQDKAVDLSTKVKEQDAELARLRQQQQDQRHLQEENLRLQAAHSALASRNAGLKQDCMGALREKEALARELALLRAELDTLREVAGNSTRNGAPALRLPRGAVAGDGSHGPLRPAEGEGPACSREELEAQVWELLARERADASAAQGGLNREAREEAEQIAQEAREECERLQEELRRAYEENAELKLALRDIQHKMGELQAEWGAFRDAVVNADERHREAMEQLQALREENLKVTLQVQAQGQGSVQAQDPPQAPDQAQFDSGDATGSGMDVEDGSGDGKETEEGLGSDDGRKATPQGEMQELRRQRGLEGGQMQGLSHGQEDNAANPLQQHARVEAAWAREKTALMRELAAVKSEGERGKSATREAARALQEERARAGAAVEERDRAVAKLAWVQRQLSFSLSVLSSGSGVDSLPLLPHAAITDDDGGPLESTLEAHRSPARVLPGVAPAPLNNGDLGRDNTLAHINRPGQSPSPLPASAACDGVTAASDVRVKLEEP